MPETVGMKKKLLGANLEKRLRHAVDSSET